MVSAVEKAVPGHRSPMTGRARAYLMVCTFHTLLIGIPCLTSPELFSISAFTAILAVLPMQAWGALHVLTGLMAALAALLRREVLARCALIASAALAGSWSIGFMFAFRAGEVISPTGMVWGMAIALCNLIVCRQPLYSPFEPIVQRVLGAERPEPGDRRRFPRHREG